jgi:hypothetical protein
MATADIKGPDLSEYGASAGAYRGIILSLSTAAIEKTKKS